MQFLSIVLLGLALLGHAAFWVGAVNRWHSVGYPRAVVKTLTLPLYAVLVAMPLVLALHFNWTLPRSPSELLGTLNWASIYLAISMLYGLGHLPIWAARRWRAGWLPRRVRRGSCRVVDVARQLGSSPARGPRTRIFSRIPYNQLWQLHLSDFEVHTPALAEELEGLSVCHWSDLHMSGRLDRSYFEEVVRLTNAMPVDVLALTGDVCDKAPCIDWVAETLGPARARVGKYFILGNHDLRTRDVDRLRDALAEAGFAYVGGRSETICDGQVIVAGDERPWFRHGPAMGPADRRSRALKILLSHTPDHLGWARRQRIDLMLAGHTHGGQICLPGIGPLVCPSRHGTKYSDGFFYEAPTMLHVSRGTASLMPLRINCPPEITRLVLTRQPLEELGTEAAGRAGQVDPKEAGAVG